MVINNKRGDGYIFPCTLIVGLFIIIWFGIYYTSLVAMIKAEKANTELAIDSYVTAESINIYNSVKNGTNYSEDSDSDVTAAILSNLFEFYDLSKEGSAYYSYGSSSNSVRFWFDNFSASLDVDSEGSQLEVTCTYTLYVPYYFNGKMVTTFSVPITIHSIYSTKLSDSYTVDDSQGASETGVESYLITLDSNLYNASSGSVANATSSGTMSLYTMYGLCFYSMSTNGYASAIDRIICPVLNGYRFCGYYSGKGGTGTCYIDENGKIIASAETFTEDVTLYAAWELCVCSITYNANGGTGSDYVQSVTSDNDWSTWNGSTFDYTGKQLIGWSLTADGSVAYELGQSCGAWTADSDLTLYAVWEDIVYTISYNGNGADSGSVDDQAVTYGSTWIAAANGFAREGYNFLGWATSSTATKATYAAGSTYSTDTNLVLYAVWEEIIDPILATYSTFPLSRLGATSIVFETSVTVDLDSVIYWDVSESQNESVVAYTTSDGVTHIANNTGSGGKIVAPVDSSWLFLACDSLENIDCTNLDTSNTTSMAGMFCECFSLTSLNLSNLDTSNVTTMREMFSDCIGLKAADVSNWDTSNVTTMYGMFLNCILLTSLDVSSWDASSVTVMSSMFFNCSSLTTIYCDSVWTPTSSVYMFAGCESLVGGNGTAYSNSYLDSVYARPDTDDVPGYFTATD